MGRILKRRAVDLLVAQEGVPEDALVRAVREAPRGVCLWERLKGHGNQVGVLAEIKRASPSEGDINAGASVVEIARRYAQSGVQAISVLTEPVWFKGTLQDLSSVRGCVDSFETRPAVLRKDFIFSKYQILESRAHGADTCLLIVAASETMRAHGETLQGLIEYARGVGMEPLVEVVTEGEVDEAIAAGGKVFGVNNRDLKTFKVDLDRTGELIAYAARAHPSSVDQVVWIGLSGVSSLSHVLHMKQSCV